MFNLVKKITLAGLGLQARANDMMEEWIRDGERNQRKEAKWVKDLLARIERDTATLDERIGEVCQKARSLIDLPSRAEMNRLSKKVDDLVSRLDQGQGAKRG